MGETEQQWRQPPEWQPRSQERAFGAIEQTLEGLVHLLAKVEGAVLAAEQQDGEHADADAEPDTIRQPRLSRDYANDERPWQPECCGAEWAELSLNDTSWDDLLPALRPAAVPAVDEQWERAAE